MAKSKSTAPAARRIPLGFAGVVELLEKAAADNAREGNRDTAVAALRDCANALKESARYDVWDAIEDLQGRVWRLRSLIDCLQMAQESGAADDLYAAFSGVLELADSIHLALDPSALEDRAKQIADDKRRKAEIDAFEAAQEAKAAERAQS